MSCRAVIKLLNYPTIWLNWLSPLFDLGARLWIANIFFKSALVKLKSWQTTLFLFEHEYNVPFLPSDIAAYFGTANELILPILVAIGFGTRIPLILLFGFNAIAVVSYPFLLTDAGTCALKDHIYWGIVIAYLMFHGYGKLSFDCLIKSFCRKCGDLTV